MFRFLDALTGPAVARAANLFAGLWSSQAVPGRKQYPPGYRPAGAFVTAPLLKGRKKTAGQKSPAVKQRLGPLALLFARSGPGRGLGAGGHL